MPTRSHTIHNCKIRAIYSNADATENHVRFGPRLVDLATPRLADLATVLLEHFDDIDVGAA